MNTLRSFKEYAEVVPHLTLLPPSTAENMYRDSMLRRAWGRLHDLATEGFTSLAADRRWYTEGVDSAHTALSALTTYGWWVGRRNAPYQGFTISDASGRTVAVASYVATDYHPTQVWFVGCEQSEGVLEARFDGDGGYEVHVAQGDHEQRVGTWHIAAAERMRRFDKATELRERSAATLAVVSRGIIAAAEGNVWQPSPVEDAARALARLPGQSR